MGLHGTRTPQDIDIDGGAVEIHAMVEGSPELRCDPDGGVVVRLDEMDQLIHSERLPHPPRGELGGLCRQTLSPPGSVEEPPSSTPGHPSGW
jgi:hypothetical protein